MTTALARINELQKRQVYYSSSLVVKLKAVKGLWYYEIHHWSDQGNIDTKSLIEQGKYTGQDPEELFKKVESVIGKTKIGKPVTKPGSSIT